MCVEEQEVDLSREGGKEGGWGRHDNSHQGSLRPQDGCGRGHKGEAEPGYTKAPPPLCSLPIPIPWPAFVLLSYIFLYNILFFFVFSISREHLGKYNTKCYRGNIVYTG